MSRAGGRQGRRRSAPVGRRSGVARTVAGAWDDSPVLTTLAVAALGSSAACTAQDLVRLVRLPPHDRITAYKAPQYWLTYRHGFVRRALPGAVLTAVRGDPTLRDAAATGAALSVAAALGVVPLACRAARHAPDDVSALLAAGSVLATPLDASLLLFDVGRYDTVGVLALEALACADTVWGLLPTSWAAPAIAGLLAAVSATQEFLPGVVAPTALARAARCTSSQRGASRAERGLRVAAVVGPAVAVSALSAAMAAPPGAVEEARHRAHRHGVAAPGDIGDALSPLERGLVDNLVFFRLFAPTSIARSFVLWGAMYAASAAVLAELLGRRRSRLYWSQAAYHAAAATGLSLLGADFRRWWGLALLGLVSTVAASPPAASPHAAPATVSTASAPTASTPLAATAPLSPQVSPPPARGRRLAAAVCVVGLAVLNVRLRRRDVYPVRHGPS